jgi:pyruvate/2-oxoglutarate dehydrogenase complex dihydrolipoamide acyltransferase (E2) component
VIADHRVLDGAAVAKALARLEEVLTTEIIAELRTARPVPAVAAA